MPRGVDRRGDPNNDLTREGIRKRLQPQDWSHPIHDPRSYSKSPWTGAVSRHQTDQELADEGETQPGVGGLENEMRRRAELEDEYGGGAGDWDH